MDGGGHGLRTPNEVELVSKELNQLTAILHVYAGVFEFYEVKKKKNVISLNHLLLRLISTLLKLEIFNPSKA